jgi:predicted nucleotidyltransferase
MTSKDKIFVTIQLHLNEITALGVRQIGVFGSYVNSKPTQDSDIDILVDFHPEQETFDNFMALYDCLEKIFAGEKIDLVTVTGLSPYIGPKILQEVQYA